MQKTFAKRQLRVRGGVKEVRRENALNLPDVKLQSQTFTSQLQDDFWNCVFSIASKNEIKSRVSGL